MMFKEMIRMFFPCTDPSVRATGRFGLYDGKLTATAVGSKLEIAFSGKSCRLHLDLAWAAVPYPHLWMQLDEGARFEVPIDRYLLVECGAGDHVLTVILKGEVEMQHRWYHPLIAKLSLIGYEADAAAVLPENRKKTIELIGDSITEGVLVDAGYAPDRNDDLQNRPYQDDVTATYAYRTALALGLEPLCGGYGAVGVTRSGCGGVPAAADMYPFCFEGVPVSYPHPDYVLINHGTNDAAADPEKFEAGYIRLLDAVYAAHPDTHVIVVTPFFGRKDKETREVINTYNAMHNRDIFLVDTTGWLPPEPLHPLRDGHKIAAEKLTAVLAEHFGL